MINSVCLVGRITKELELRYTPTNIPYCRFTLAVNRPFSNQQGDRQADFISLLVWRKQAENLVRFMTKGSMIGVRGRIQTGSYDGQDGNKVYTTDVVCEEVSFLESKKTNSDNQQSNQYQYANNQQNNQPYNSAPQNNYGFSGAGTSTNDPYSQQTNEDPFSNKNPSREVSEDDLPF